MWFRLCLGCGFLTDLTSCHSSTPAGTMGAAYARCRVVDRMGDQARLSIVIVDSSCTPVPPLTIEIIASESESDSPSRDASVAPQVPSEARRSGDRESFDSDRIFLPSAAPPKIRLVGNCPGNREFAAIVQCARI